VRKKNCWIHNAPRYWNRELVAPEQSERASDAEPVSETLRERQPLAVVDAISFLRKPPNLPRSNGEAKQNNRGTSNP